MVLLLATVSQAEEIKPKPLSDGQSFAGWTGDTNHTWHIEDGAFVGGSAEKDCPAQ